MKYHDYMAQFALPEETKSVLAGRMKQRVRRLNETGEAPVRHAASEEVSSKKNTFRLHPMRWAAIFMSIALVATATPLLAIFLPRGEEQIVSNEIKLDYMKDLMVETEGVTAYSIRRETVEEPAAQSLAAAGGSKGAAISFFPDLIAEEGGFELLAESETKERTYLYSTTASYEAGNVEYDEAGIQKVTFMKNREVTDDVYDENGQLIDLNRRIGQDELDAQINRMYATKRFTFVQFVPILESRGEVRKVALGKTVTYEAAKVYYRGEDGGLIYSSVALRPHGLEYDENGITSFDSGGEYFGDYYPYDDGGCGIYFSSPFSASFVIDNTTGYFYKIEGFGISGFDGGLVVGAETDWEGRYIDTQKSIYALSVDSDDNLVFTDIMPNKDITVKEAFMDNDGWTYVCNDTLDETDMARKIIYFTTGDYVQDKEGNVYIKGRLMIDGVASIGYPTLTHKMVDGVATPFENHGLLKLRIDRDENSDKIFGMYDSISIYGGGIQSSIQGSLFACGEEERAGLCVDMMSEWLDDNFDMLLGERDGKLYYCPVDLSECVDKMVTINGDEFTPLCDFEVEKAEDYYLSVGNDQYKVEHVYRHKEANETKYYRVVRTETGLGLEELTSKSYADNVFIFQPINK